jgi:hypothetical protein
MSKNLEFINTTINNSSIHSSKIEPFNNSYFLENLCSETSLKIYDLIGQDYGVETGILKDICAEWKDDGSL